MPQHAPDRARRPPRCRRFPALAAAVVGVAAVVAVLAVAFRGPRGGDDDVSARLLALRVTGGQSQTAVAGTLFPAALSLSVRTAAGVPAVGERVVFSAPGDGPSAEFDGGHATTVRTDATGTVATRVRAGYVEGTVVVTAEVEGSPPARFRLRVRAPTLVAAGDIACAPGMPATAVQCAQQATAALIGRLHPTAVLPLGDTQYETGQPDEYASYAASWGRYRAIEFPVPGNHEYGYGESRTRPTGGVGYFRWFGARGHPLDPECTRLCRSWYSFDLGAWHVVALDSECQVVGGCTPGSPQYEWLLDDLAAHPAACTLAYWHIPVRSSSADEEPVMEPMLDALLARGADVVLTAHAHSYERFAPLDADGRPDPAHGIREFVVGTGGRNLEPFAGSVAPGSEFRQDTSFGVLQLTLLHGRYTWRFLTPAGAVLDSGADRCHDAG